MFYDYQLNYSLVTFRSGVYAEPNCGAKILGYHAITAVGYGTLNGVPYWVRWIDIVAILYFYILDLKMLFK